MVGYSSISVDIDLRETQFITAVGIDENLTKVSWYIVIPVVAS